MKTGLVYGPVYLEHDTGRHVENAGRLRAIMQLLEESGLAAQTVAISPQPVPLDLLHRVHSPSLVRTVAETARHGGGWLDPDTFVSPASYNAALHAAGGALQATAAVLDGKVQSCLALVRPPGHHATPDRAMGFCLFNNIAVAGRYALDQGRRVLVVDFDVHHGNGTQEVFYAEPRLLYFSLHQYPFYPGTGWIGETGSGEGIGATINVPLPAWSGDEEYRRAFAEVLVPAARRFRPDVILVSAGYDAHWADPISLMQVTTGGYAGMAETLRDLAAELCAGRSVFLLEGGYHLPALAHSVRATLEVLLEKKGIADPLGGPEAPHTPPNIDQTITAVKRMHRL